MNCSTVLNTAATVSRHTRIRTMVSEPDRGRKGCGASHDKGGNSTVTSTQGGALLTMEKQLRKALGGIHGTITVRLLTTTVL